MRCIVVLGRQGSGKGVQSARLAERLGFDHVSTGDLLRHAIDEGTPLGKGIERLVAAGGLVPDDVVAGVVAERLAVAEVEGRGVVLDGYPRTDAQAERLAALLAPVGIEAAVHIDVPRAVALGRVLRRRVCRLCGTTGDATVCARCGGPTSRRTDDAEEAIGRRMSEYAAAISSLRSWLALHTRLVDVDGLGPPDAVEDRIARALGLDRQLANG